MGKCEIYEKDGQVIKTSDVISKAFIDLYLVDDVAVLRVPTRFLMYKTLRIVLDSWGILGDLVEDDKLEHIHEALILKLVGEYLPVFTNFFNKYYGDGDVGEDSTSSLPESLTVKVNINEVTTTKPVISMKKRVRLFPRLR